MQSMLNTRFKTIRLFVTFLHSSFLKTELGIEHRNSYVNNIVHLPACTDKEIFFSHGTPNYNYTEKKYNQKELYDLFDRYLKSPEGQLETIHYKYDDDEISTKEYNKLIKKWEDKYDKEEDDEEWF